MRGGGFHQMRVHHMSLDEWLHCNHYWSEMQCRKNFMQCTMWWWNYLRHFQYLHTVKIISNCFPRRTHRVIVNSQERVQNIVAFELSRTMPATHRHGARASKFSSTLVFGAVLVWIAKEHPGGEKRFLGLVQSHRSNSSDTPGEEKFQQVSSEAFGHTSLLRQSPQNLQRQPQPDNHWPCADSAQQYKSFGPSLFVPAFLSLLWQDCLNW